MLPPGDGPTCSFREKLHDDRARNLLCAGVQSEVAVLTEPAAVDQLHLHVDRSGEQTVMRAVGAWVAESAAIIEAEFGLVLGPGAPLPAEHHAILDLSRIEKLDTYGALLIASAVERQRARGGTLEVLNVPTLFASLLQAVGNARPEPPPPAARGSMVANVLDRSRSGIVGAGRDLLVLLDMLGATAHALAAVVARPATFRSTSTVHHLDRVGLQALPIVLLITILIGGIIAQQGFFHFRKFGADEYVVDMVGILVLREIGVLIVAIMVAGRSGSSYTAELGSMKMREEIDALRTMGLDPVAVLILPRVIALVIALPILAFLGSMSALLGGGLVAWLYAGMSPEIFIARLKEAITLTHFQVGIIKAPFMALVIGIVACAEGLKVKGSSESLGLQTTASVVKAIFLVIVLDGLFAIFFASIGM